MIKILIKKIFILSVTLLSIPAVWIFIHYSNVAVTKADCAVVFGAAVWSGDRPSHALDDRVRAGIDLYKAGLTNNCLIFSGGFSAPNRRHEADVMRDIAIAAGVPADAISTDYDGIKTLTTIKNLSPKNSYILVSNDFHLGRIALFAQRANLESATHASTYLHGRYYKEPFFVFREIVALWYYGLRIDLLRTFF